MDRCCREFERTPWDGGSDTEEEVMGKPSLTQYYLSDKHVWPHAVAQLISALQVQQQAAPTFVVESHQIDFESTGGHRAS